MDSPLVSVIIPTLGRYEPLLNTVRDLLDQDYVTLEVIVVDQNTDWPVDLHDALDELKSDSRVRWIDGFPTGVVRARNHAAARAQGDLLLFVDDDVWIPDTAFVSCHVRAHEEPGVACVCGRELKLSQVQTDTGTPLEPASGGRQEAPPGSPLRQLLNFDRSQAVSAEVPSFSTCNGSVQRQAFFRMGGFDENFRGASYGDDADFALRLWSRGERIIFDPRPWLVHLMSPTGGLRLSDPNSSFNEQEKCLSGLIVLFRHAGIGEAWAILYGWVLRRSVLLRRNITHPWRQPKVLLGLATATIQAWNAVRRGPYSNLPDR